MILCQRPQGAEMEVKHNVIIKPKQTLYETRLTYYTVAVFDNFHMAERCAVSQTFFPHKASTNTAQLQNDLNV